MTDEATAVLEDHADAKLILFGNPCVIDAVTVRDDETGQLKVTGRRARPELGTGVTKILLPTIDAAGLHGHWEQLKGALAADPGTQMLRLATQEQDLALFELPFKHILQVVLLHAARGVEWIHSDDQELEQLLAEFLKATPGLPAEPLPPLAGGAGLMLEQHGDMLAAYHAAREAHLKMNLGIDLVLEAGFTTSAQPAAANYMALSSNKTAAANKTTLTEELSKLSGGLNRKQATFAHTAETSTATLTALFTCNGSDTLPVKVEKIGIFNKSSSGTLFAEDLITETPFNVSGDNATVTYTLTET